MNEAELARNSVLTEHVVADLNADPSLPFEDASFDCITNAVSVDYLTRPLEVFRCAPQAWLASVPAEPPRCWLLAWRTS